MRSIEGLKHQIESVETMQSIVSTMKTLAAVNIHQFEQAVSSLAAYVRSVETGLQALLQAEQRGSIRVEVSNAKVGVIVFGTDQGLVGAFNRQIAKFSLDTLNGWQAKEANRNMIVVGIRLAKQMEQMGQRIENRFEVPSSISGITPLVQELLWHILNWRAEREIEKVALLYNSPEQGAAYSSVSRLLLPLDPDWLRQLEQKPWPRPVVPFFRQDWQDLFAALIREHFFVSLYRALADSMTSENASRLAAMEAAEKNIEDYLDDLNQQYKTLRQSSITSEILDITVSYKALLVDEERFTKA